MEREPHRGVLEKVDGLIFVLGCLGVLLAIVDAVRSRVSLLTAGHRLWTSVEGIVLVCAIVGIIAVVSRGLQRRAERLLVRKFRK